MSVNENALSIFDLIAEDNTPYNLGFVADKLGISVDSAEVLANLCEFKIITHVGKRCIIK